MKRIISVLALAAFAVAMLVGPAAAAEVVAVQGTASVGTSFSTACASDGTATVTGAGLTLPTVGTAPSSAVYQLSTTVASAPNGVGTLNVCGNIGAGALDVSGPRCGSSSGSGGVGKVDYTDAAATDLTLTNVGWANFAGGTLIISGTANGSAIRGVIQAVGNGCAGAGATSFTVAGVVTDA